MQDENPQQSQVSPKSSCHPPSPVTQSSHSSETQTSAIKVKVIGNGITGEDLMRYFSRFGSVLQVPDIMQGSPDYAYVNFKSSEEARAASQTNEVHLKPDVCRAKCNTKQKVTTSSFSQKEFKNCLI